MSLFLIWRYWRRHPYGTSFMDWFDAETEREYQQAAARKAAKRAC